MKTTLLLGLHSHQPIDNFDHVVLDAAARSYRPFFEVASAYKDFKFSVHYSGWLLEFIQKHDSELFALMQEMSKNGQIEWFTGGFYEPILASIPSSDRKKQIEKLSSFIKTHFDQTPKGLWLTERVWDPSIVEDLHDLGIKYAVVDDYHILCTGESKADGYYTTESGGKKLALFPISQSLRYQVPFWEADQVVANLEELQGMACIFDDGEKFGVWPGTFEWVYEKGWLKSFIEQVLSSDKISTDRYSNFYAENRPKKLLYPPTVSYFEMGEWSLDADSFGKFEKIKQHLEQNGFGDDLKLFLRGATWQNFLVKFEESSRIHKRALSLSLQNPQNSREFDEALMKAECNDVLWHGIFGGIYLPSLRDTAYRYLIEAESLLAKPNGIYLEDWNLDGTDEARFVTDSLIVGFEPKGGKLTELNLKKERFNYLNVLTRYSEAYHSNIELASPDQDESGVKTIHDSKLKTDEESFKHIVTDKYTRGGFVDHLSDSIDAKSFFCQSFISSDHPNIYYDLASTKTSITMKSSEIKKKIVTEKSAITVTTEIDSDKNYYQEHNFHFALYDQIVVNGKPLEESMSFEADKSIIFADHWLQKTITITASVPFVAHLHTLYTVSQSESGVDLTAQQVALLLDFGSNKKVITKLEIGDIQ